MFPAGVTVSASVYHLPSSGTSEYPASADGTVSGALLPLDRKEHALEGASYQNPFDFYCIATEDIRPSDKLVISSTTYYVKKVFMANFGGLAHKRCTIDTEA